LIPKDLINILRHKSEKDKTEKNIIAMAEDRRIILFIKFVFISSFVYNTSYITKYKGRNMAILSELVKVNEQPHARKNVIGDYCFNENYFQIRTYKAGDISRTEGQKQNIQIDKDMALQLINLLNQFIEQN